MQQTRPVLGEGAANVAFDGLVDEVLHPSGTGIRWVGGEPLGLVQAMGCANGLCKRMTWQGESEADA